MRKEKPNLNYKFHHPNPEQLSGMILQVCIEANITRIDKILAQEMMENQEKEEEKIEKKTV